MSVEATFPARPELPRQLVAGGGAWRPTTITRGASQGVAGETGGPDFPMTPFLENDP